MSIKSHITDKDTGISAEVVKKDACDCQALAVATVPYREFENSIKFFTNSTYGANMNQDAGAGGTPEEIHDGIDTTLWTASDIVGGDKTTFDNDDHAYGGTITVVDYSIIDPTDSFTINTTTRTETTHWTAETSNDVTATNIATDITNNVTGFTAEATGAIVSVTCDTGYDITTFTTNADAGEMTASGQSVKVDNSPVDDVFQFAKGSDVDLTNYVSLSMWVYVDKDWKLGDDIRIYGWDTDTNAQVGLSIGLQNYFTYNDYDVWHQLIIPLTDMEIENLTTLDALRIQIVAAEGKSAKFYLDDIQFEETGAPIIFELKPDKGTWLHVENYKISMADATAGTLSDATMPLLAYDSFLGVSLIVGMTYLRQQDETIKFSLQVKNLIEFLQLPGAEVSGYGSDGTNTWLTLEVKHTEPLVLKEENDDVLRFAVNDDMTGLLHLKISAGCKVENRE